MAEKGSKPGGLILETVPLGTALNPSRPTPTPTLTPTP